MKKLLIASVLLSIFLVGCGEGDWGVVGPQPLSEPLGDQTSWVQHSKKVQKKPVVPTSRENGQRIEDLK